MKDYWYPDWDYYYYVHKRMIQEFGGHQGLEYSSKWFREVSIHMFNAIIQKIRDLDAGLIEKGAYMLIELTRNRIWADGQKRSAYVTTKTFLELNGGSMSQSDPDAVTAFMKNLTFKYSRNQVEKWIRDGQMPI